MREQGKRFIAFMQTVVLVVALVSGVSFNTISDVNAATDGELSLNIGKTILMSESSQTYGFTVPETGYYYFFTEGEAWSDGELNVNDGEYTVTEGIGDGLGSNFRIEEYLQKDDYCEITVTGAVNFEYNLFVCNEEEADNHVMGLTYGLDYYVYAKVGESCTFTAMIESIAGKKHSELPDGFSVKWEKEIENTGTNGDPDIDDDLITVDLNCNSLTYTVQNINETDFNSYMSTRYKCELYNEEEYVSYQYYNIYDKSRIVSVECGNKYAHIGDTLTLQPIVRDYDGNLMELNEDDFEVDWYLYDYDEYINGCYLSSGITYTIESVKEEDLHSLDNMVYIECVVLYKGGSKVYDDFYILEGDEPITTTTVSNNEQTTTKISETTKSQEITATNNEPETQDTATKNNVSEQSTQKAELETEFKNTKKAKIKKIARGQKNLKISWNKVKNINGYQIQYSISKRFTKAKSKTVKGYKKTAIKIKKLKAKKKYYVRIRTYVVYEGKKYYSAWSKVKKQKTK